jgi:hypothetical protein
MNCSKLAICLAGLWSCSIVEGQIPVLNGRTVQFVPAAGRSLPDAYSFAYDGDVAVIGASRDATLAPEGGTAYVYERQSDGRWLERAQLLPASAQRCSHFGSKVAISGAVILVGYDGREANPRGEGCTFESAVPGHTVSVFERGGSEWAETATFRYFTNASLDIDGTNVAIGRIGGADVYRHVAFGVWEGPTFLQRTGIGGYPDDGFTGLQADVSGERVIVATSSDAYPDTGRTSFYMRANVFERSSDGVWTLAADITTDQIRFGLSALRGPTVSIAGDALTINDRIYVRDRYGSWTQHASTAGVSGAGSASLVSASLVNEHLALTQSDVLQRGADDFWRPLARLQRGTATSEPAAAGATRLLASDRRGQFWEYEVPAVGRIPMDLKLQAVTDVVGPDDVLVLRAHGYSHEDSGANVESLEYRIEGGDWQPMQPVDGAYDQKYEEAVANLLVSSLGILAPGSYRFCLRGTDSAGRATELLDQASDSSICAQVELVPRQSAADSWPPELSELGLYRDQVLVGQDNSLYVFADDVHTGGSSIRSMQYRIDTESWRPLASLDGQFGESGDTYETGFAILPVVHQLGSHEVCARAVDTTGNVTVPRCLLFEVVSN